MFHKPPALRPGDLIAIAAPAGPFDRDSFERGLAIIAARYRVQSEPDLFASHRYMAGDDPRRLRELRSALGNPDVRAVFCARGGYGTMRLLPLLDSPIAAKPVVGFSDITALHLWCQRYGSTSIHGPVLTQLGSQPESVRARLFELLESGSPPAPLRGVETYVGGQAEGPLIGGNLSVLTRLLGTPFMPPLDGAILLLEEIAERPYRLDRMWTHLRLAGVFGQVKGIVLGSFTSCEERGAAYSSTDVLSELAVAAGLPCAAGFPIGHGDINEPVALGARVHLDASARSLEFLEAAVDIAAR